ncbi:MAG: hypothetical protein HW373_42 [Deltaproteobacteria bacterium]|nr:hypothetical protein [Deltaproteobacteria bacterium]
MTTETDLQHQESPPAVMGDPQAVADCLTQLGKNLRAGVVSWRGETPREVPANARSKPSEQMRKKPRPILPMNWNEMHVGAREEICLGAGIAERIARQPWEGLETWLQFLLAESMLLRTHGRVALKGERFVAWEVNDSP